MTRSEIIRNYVNNNASSKLMVACERYGGKKGYVWVAVLDMTYENVNAIMAEKLDFDYKTGKARLRFRRNKAIVSYINQHATNFINLGIRWIEYDKAYEKYNRQYGYRHKNEDGTPKKLNRGWYFEKLIYNHYGKRWKGWDNDPFYKKGDITLDGITYQIKFYNGEAKYK